jgi:hypothetical protein
MLFGYKIWFDFLKFKTLCYERNNSYKIRFVTHC